MKYYDLHVFSNNSIGENNINELAIAADALGYSGIAISDMFHSIEKLKQIKRIISSASKKIGCEIFHGVEIRAKNPQELSRLVSRLREQVLILIVSGGDYNINRAACENPKVDILAHPEMGRPDNGLDEACLRAAAENKVAIEINFREILYGYRKPRAYILNHIATNIKLCDETKAKMVICSAVQSIWDMRTPREMAALANVLGMDISKAVSSVSDIPQAIIEENKKKLEGKIPVRGVEVL